MIYVGGFVESRGFDHAGADEFVDDEVDEVNLVGAELSAVEVGAECFHGGFSVQADKLADKQSEPVGSLLGLCDIGGLADSAGDQHALERLEIVWRERFVAAKSLQGQIAFVPLEVSGRLRAEAFPVGSRCDPLQVD